MSVRHPRVIGGVCERCGILNSGEDSRDQYKFCEHYRGMQLNCSYHNYKQGQSVEDMITHEILNVADNPFNPNELVVWCGEFECSRKHKERFDPSSR
jgi:hypothetical protein